MSSIENEDKKRLFQVALEYVTDRLAKREKLSDYPLNRGDIILLVMLIEQELGGASSDWKEPLNAKRLTALREKLGDIVDDAPLMSKVEAQQFRE